jgi:hypothetical protein
VELTYYIWENDAEVGPFTLSQMRSIWSSGRITLRSLVRLDTDTEWKEASEFDLIHSPPIKSPPLPAPQPVSVTNLEMPFGSMVVFMCKWAIAAIPAAIILVLLFFGIGIILTTFGVVLSGISGR